MIIRALALALLFLSACARPAPPTDAPASRACIAPPGAAALWAQLWAQPGMRYVLIGEVHGTAETPAAFGEIVCAASAERRVLVGLEWDESAQGAYDAYLASPGEAADRARFFADAWSARWAADGRSSEAMFALIERLRLLRQAGHAVDLATFVRPRASGGASQTPYEQGLAASLQDAAARSGAGLVLVLVGNLHARKAPIEGPNGFLPMATHLPDDQTLAINVNYSGGAAWTCQQDGCGAHAMAGPPAPAGLNLFDTPDDFGYDGVLNLGVATASPPYDGA